MKSIINLISKALKNIDTNTTVNSSFPTKISGKTSIEIPEIPTTTDEFIQLRNKYAREPLGAIHMFVIATLQYTIDPLLGRHWTIIATDKRWLSPSNATHAYHGYDVSNSMNFSLTLLDNKPYLPYSYLRGSNSEQAYHVNQLPYIIDIEKTTDAGDEMVKIFLNSTGADSSRPITVKANSQGIWKVFECSTFFTDVRKPTLTGDASSIGDF